MGTWKHVFGPAKGMKTNDPPMGIPPEASPFIKGCYIKDGEVCTDFGHSKFPEPGNTKTNKLHGSVLKIDQLYALSGLSWLIALTTTNAYTYNTSNDTWDLVTQGVAVDGGESAWTANANATATADTTYKLKGSKSAKVAIGAAFTTGVAAYFNFDAVDCTGKTALHFWIRSSVAVAANKLQVGISETTAMGGSPTYFNVPALAANTWTPCCVDGTFTDLNAIISVGLKVVEDLGAMDVYIDDIVAVKRFTGDMDNRWSTTIMNDTFICTNGVDQMQAWTGTGYFADHSTALAAGSITTSEIVFSFKDHLLAMNNTENSADCPQRVSWTNIGTTNDWIGGTAGYQDLVDDVSWVVAVGPLSENKAIIYKERSIVIMEWVGGHTPFRFHTMVTGTGALGKDCIDSGSGEHLVLGPDVTFSYKGGDSIEILDDNIKKTMYGRLNRGYCTRSFILYIEEDDELQVWIPTEAEVPDEVWCEDVVKESWYRKNREMTGCGYYQEQTSKTIGDLIGTIGEQNWRFGDMLTKAYAPVTLIGAEDGSVYKLDKNTLNNDGSAIYSEFQTPDFLASDAGSYGDKELRVTKLAFEAAGQTITTEYSTDGGNTWNPTCGAGENTTTLKSDFDYYDGQDFDITTKKIRFRFTKNTVSKGFKLRYYGFYATVVRSGR